MPVSRGLMGICKRQTAVIVIVLFSFSLISVLRDLESAQPPRDVLQAGQSREEIAASGSLSRPAVKVGENVRFWLTVRNLAPKSIFTVRLLQLHAPGYKVSFLSSCPEQRPVDETSSQMTTTHPPGVSSETAIRAPCSVIAAELKPGQSTTVWGDLRAGDVRDRQTLMVIVGWAGSEKIESRLALPLGESVIQSKASQLLSVIRDFRDLLKDFALPLVLVLLGLGYQFWDKRREQARQEQEQLRTQIAETWSKMLPESHQLATQYYMPVEANARGAIEDILQFLKDGDPQKEKRGFFFLIIFERGMRHLHDSVGGFYFKNRLAEELAVYCYEEYQALYYYRDENTLRRLSAMLNNADIHERIASFLDKLEGKDGEEIAKVFSEGWNDFREWVVSDKCLPALRYLQGFRLLLRYEMNRPYDYWYGETEGLQTDRDTEEAILSLAEKIGEKTAGPNFLEEVKKYLEEAKSPAKLRL